MSRVPQPYAGAPQLSAAARSALAGARLTWDELTADEQASVAAGERDARGLVWVRGRERARKRLVNRGLADRLGADAVALTPLGVLVRQAGIFARVEVPDVS